MVAIFKGGNDFEKLSYVFFVKERGGRLSKKGGGKLKWKGVQDKKKKQIQWSTPCINYNSTYLKRSNTPQ